MDNHTGFLIEIHLLLFNELGHRRSGRDFLFYIILKHTSLHNFIFG